MGGASGFVLASKSQGSSNKHSPSVVFFSQVPSLSLSWPICKMGFLTPTIWLL